MASLYERIKIRDRQMIKNSNIDKKVASKRITVKKHPRDKVNDRAYYTFYNFK